MSRLLEDSEKIRENLETRNLFNPNDPYNLFRYDKDDDDPHSPYLDKREVANTVNAIAGIIKPFSSFDLTKTILYRTIGPSTPLAQISVVMLEKQFIQTAASNASRDFLPAISFKNIFDGNSKTKFFMRKRDFQITRRETQGNVGRILDAITGTYDYVNHGNRLPKNTTATEYVKNTGKGQLEVLTKNINKNLYKLENSGFINALGDDGYNLELGDTQLVNNLVFPFSDSNFYPFKQYNTGYKNISVANYEYNQSEIKFLRENEEYGVKEYGNNDTYLNSMGKTIFKDNNENKEYVFDSQNFGLDDDPINQLIWGRDGVSEAYKNSLGTLVDKDSSQKTIPNESPNNRFDSSDKFSDFGIKTGILNYTKELLNSKGQYGSFDLTRKKFLSPDNQLHFNGSPLNMHPDGKAIDNARSHSMADPYNRYAKAIRFDGNIIYNGHEDSVIFDSVLPKIAPSRKDNRNMMFSLENLAVQVVRDESAGVAYIQDVQTTSLPLCEGGPAGGRLMWFPPYDVKLSENAVARWDSNTFIGRSEPIYTYNTSERLANLSFKLLIDYPQQLLEYRSFDKSGIGKGLTYGGGFHKKAAEFFAFGGEGSPQFDTNLSQKEILLIEKIAERDSIAEKPIYVEPNLPQPKDFELFFPNDNPKISDNLKTVVKTNFSNMSYEDGEKVTAKDPGLVDNGLNKPFLENLSGFTNVLREYFTPSDSNLYNKEKQPYIDISIGASATKLYNSTRTGISEEDYNKKLSERRQEATVEYIKELFLTTFGKSSVSLRVKINAPISQAVGSISDKYDNSSTVDEKGAKEERASSILFYRNDIMLTIDKNKELEAEQEEDIKKLNEEIAALESEIKNIKRRMTEYSPCIYKPSNKEDGIEKGFKSFVNEKFNSVFHSQTPEDFHRRLTFLHQCTKQGPSIRLNTGDNDNGVDSSVNSVFGRQPVCIFRYGDFFHTKVIIDNISFNYDESTWDTNPEGFGMQPMICDVSIQMKLLGGQSLKTPIDALQNAISFNYYANSTFTKNGTYSTPTYVEEQQILADGDSGLDKRTDEELEAYRKESNFTLKELQSKGLGSSIGAGAAPKSLS